MKRLFRRLRKKIGIYTSHEIQTTYSNALVHGQKLSDEDILKKGPDMIKKWMNALNNY